MSELHPQVFPSEETFASLTDKEKSGLALEAKAIGNKYFTSKRYQKALELYSQAIKLHADPIYYSNRAACHASLNDYEAVVDDCNKALELDRGYVKALTRRARAFENLGRVGDALNGGFIDFKSVS
jgi:import receptor subunit TOM70